MDSNEFSSIFKVELKENYNYAQIIFYVYARSLEMTNM